MKKFHLVKVVCFSFCLAGTLLLGGCSHEKQRLTLVGTADIQGFVEPSMHTYECNGTKKRLLSGGIAKIASVIEKAKEENPHGTFVLSSGDDLLGRYFHMFKGEAIYRLMSQSGYTLYAPGNHEFDKGTATFSHALEYAAFETLCSDLSIKDTSLEGRCLPYKIIEAAGTKVGFFSLMTEQFSFITSAGKVKVAERNVDTARKMVATLRAKRCNVIIAITHIGLPQDRVLAQKVKGIDVIFGGHSHKETHAPVRVNDTLIVNGGEKGAYALELKLPLDATHHIEKASIDYRLIPLVDSVPANREVERLLENYKAQLPATIVLGTTTVPWDLQSDTLRRGESNVINLINDLLWQQFGVDVVMNNAGAFRGEEVYPPGDITDKMLHEIDAFSNNAYRMVLSGEYIHEVLEHSATRYDKGGLIHCSGLRYTIDLSKQAQEIEQKADGSWYIATPGERIGQVTIVKKDGTRVPLDRHRNYTVLSNSYLVTHAGDGYYWFGKYGMQQKNTYTTFYSIMASYLEKYKVMNPKPLDGRLKIIP